MRTWDDVKYLYYSIAKTYLRYHHQIDADELVNEAWLMTHPYINIKGYKLVHKIHRIMQAYIKSQEKNVYQHKLVKHEVFVDSLDEIFENIESFDRTDFIAVNDDHEIIDIQDYIEKYSKRLNYEERIILYLYYEKSFTYDEIGRVFGLTGERIRQKKESALIKMGRIKHNEKHTCDIVIIPTSYGFTKKHVRSRVSA